MHGIQRNLASHVDMVAEPASTSNCKVIRCREAVDYIYPIAGGTKLADLPIEQPTHFELSVNVRVARDLDWTLTPTILAWADEAIA